MKLLAATAQPWLPRSIESAHAAPMCAKEQPVKVTPAEPATATAPSGSAAPPAQPGVSAVHAKTVDCSSTKPSGALGCAHVANSKATPSKACPVAFVSATSV